MVQQEQVIVIGGGPCGLSAAIELMDRGMSPLVIEKGNIVHAIYKYPTHQQFFSTSEKLAIGGVPFYSTERKPKRNEALVYYRKVAEEKNVRVNSYEEVQSVTKYGNVFTVETVKKGYVYQYSAQAVVIATGYYDSANYMNIPGEELPHVLHYFHEGHAYFKQDVVVIGGKNSAVDAALELDKAGARVTVLYRGAIYSPSIKPWILPEFESLVKHGKIRMEFEATPVSVEKDHVTYKKDGETKTVASDFVFAMTGYHPDHNFIKKMGVDVDEVSGRPLFNEETMETNVDNIFIAGVLAAGNNANEIFIENGRFHGEQIAKALQERLVQTRQH
ncbi:YpdA family putative bacillithiol disulfide reductase [Paenalkalicoccus suaedae]|uniref:YpdA family putative bacillithiol disulfide reductase n=1 Tax=Paenalkalicoccus suaedae TaxID=2592382 RepID=A0A859FDB3_9BACI|nr:YpdA family putative bacillithiol disulfide reductase [Paenalkalicoccus suaedae]QKS71067.1 YpdA family putative bacillithiol disulfide reductase [Paenalkalicoccus suaedae]